MATAAPALSLRENRNLDHIPGEYGMPIFGSTFEYLRDPHAWTDRMVRTYGRMFRRYMFFEVAVNAVGPEVTERVLTDREDLFSSHLGWWVTLGRFFPQGLMLRDFDDHKRHRRIMQTVFRKSALAQYVEIINPLLLSALDGWERQHDEGFPLYASIKETTLRTAAAVFTGLGGNDPRLAELNRDFIRVIQGAMAVVRVPLPFTATARGVRARQSLHRFFAELIPQRRNGHGSDLLTHMCNARSEEGDAFTDPEIVEHMAFLMMASHDTTTSALTNLVLELARHPELQERYREQSAALPSDLLDFDAMPQLRGVYDAFRESLRLYSPVQTIPRRTTRECELLGHRIPANTVVWLSPELNHRLPELWTDPGRFDPERFSDARAEHRSHRFAWAPFGGGAHTCMGLAFSELQAKTFMHLLLRRYRWSLTGEAPKTTYIPFPRPVKDPPLSFERIH